MMPVVFAGHGSPMNAIEDNTFTRGWRDIAAMLPKPEAILCVSAHWETNGTKVCTAAKPATIHDFYGFPQALFDVRYSAEGSPLFAAQAINLLAGKAAAEPSWGLDHGAWSVLRVMYPQADIPVFQMSIDRQARPEELFELGAQIAPLRERGVLIIGSGNIVHNLGAVDFRQQGGFEWAVAFDTLIHEKIDKRDFDGIIDYTSAGKTARLSVPTAEHFNPLLYILGASHADDSITVFNDACVYGSLSMTSYVFS